MRLSNGAKILDVYIKFSRMGFMHTGVVLAETDTNFVTWNIHHDPDHNTPDVWDCDTGHYFTKGGQMQQGKSLFIAQRDFGERLARHLSMVSMAAYEGLKATCEP